MESLLGKLIQQLVMLGLFNGEDRKVVFRQYTIETCCLTDQLSVSEDGTLLYTFKLEGNSHSWHQGWVVENDIIIALVGFMLQEFPVQRLLERLDNISSGLERIKEASGQFATKLTELASDLSASEGPVLTEEDMQAMIHETAGSNPSFCPNGVYNPDLHKLSCEELDQMYPIIPGLLKPRLLNPEVTYAVDEAMKVLESLPLFQEARERHILSQFDVRLDVGTKCIHVHQKINLIPGLLAGKEWSFGPLLATLNLNSTNQTYFDPEVFGPELLIKVLTELGNEVMVRNAHVMRTNEEDIIDSSFIPQMKDGHYIPKPDEPSPFENGGFPWMTWKKRNDQRISLRATFHGLRLQLISILEKEPYRTAAHLDEEVPSNIWTSTGHLSLGYVIHIRYQTDVSWKDAHVYATWQRKPGPAVEE
jgi:hypothetical protein